MADGIQRVRNAIYQALDEHDVDREVVHDVLVDDIVLAIEAKGQFQDGILVIPADENEDVQ